MVWLDYGIANNNGKLNNYELNKVFQYMFEQKIFSLDTAKAYGNSEELIGNYLANYDKKINGQLPQSLAHLVIFFLK